jgi:phosphinothricin acetyltransferase
MSVRLRQAVSADLPRVTAIYNFYVRHGHATFDDVEVRPEDRRTCFETFDADEPYLLLVAEIDGTVAGYAASSRYRPARGFREVGTFTEYAAKDGQLISSTWFEKLLRRRR